ncbi:hypothetical protein LWI29_029140 [Acer saccharum]|uniref:Uncharacterized protein n=1 Tax=Acer saccharum TaxID=4024 RepID=A0AA39RDZ6_ACESA|nr:hypothetical protein LWI29_029140 [Acer saccharum]
MIGSVSERGSIVSIPVDNVMMQQVEEVGGLVDIETDREFSNDNELVAEGIDISASRESVREGINDEKQVGEGSEVVFEDRGKSVKDQQITKGSQAHPIWAERPSASFKNSDRIRDTFNIKRGSNVARIRKLGISTDSSKQFCGKCKSISEEGGPNFEERKTRKIDGISTMEDEFSKSKSESGSSGMVTGNMVSPTEEEVVASAD